MPLPVAEQVDQCHHGRGHARGRGVVSAAGRRSQLRQ